MSSKGLKLLMQVADNLARHGDTDQAQLHWQEALMKLPVDSSEYKAVLFSLQQSVPDSFLALAQETIGVVEGPGDLSHNKNYLQGFGK